MKEVFGLAPEIPPEETVRSAEGWLEPDGRIRDILPEETRSLASTRPSAYTKRALGDC